MLEGCKLPQHDLIDLQFWSKNLSLDLCVVAKLAVHAFAVLIGSLVYVFVAGFSVDVVTLACQVRPSACCMPLAYPSFSQLRYARAEISPRASELRLCSCVLSAAAADYNVAVPQGLHL